MSAASRYDELIALLDRHQAAYRMLTHAAEGRTEIVSAMRGNPIDHAAKCIIVMVKVGKKTTRYVLAVVPGGSRVDLAQVKKVLGGTYAAFASPNVAEELAGSVVGTVLPFQRASSQVRGCLDRSVALRTEDYRRVAMPRVEHIAQQSG